jgi:SAM-dependent methyltransferase
MRQIQKLLRYSALFGIDIKKLFFSLQNFFWFINNLNEYNKKNTTVSLRAKLANLYPVLNERSSVAGDSTSHYFYQDLWAARKIYKRNPETHIDIGSKINSFISHLLVFRNVTVIDIRPLENNIPGLNFIQSDATTLNNFPDNSIDSLSSLHAVEHFGLGRYGDTIDPDACFKVMKSMTRVLKAGGILYFSVPIGKERVEFNAHRIFNPQTIIDQFSSLKLLSFSVVDDNGNLIENTDCKLYTDSVYSCGLFEFTK